jgi:hypothetical protein
LDIATRVGNLFPAVATKTAGYRPDCVEPHVFDREPKGCKRMYQPRDVVCRSRPAVGI